MHVKWKYFDSVELRMTKEKQGSIWDRIGR